ncbi:hypothetical protein [Lactobacillus pentosus] [Lactiplantibacillus mudanjiangensis]|uniref:DUF1648 domain-containing protein n=1 Tax=Lactiplantibacillus mudanjiangensis TaxID=1296538 RepID=UPI0010159894|nr:DUF1648 domain-containing protein [Lactiplantibacillus mudanjiangensis]VDG31136.1 hypothetical protein [Lactobacillus pentosus] [Lactiplantibacillus mudanjiangensis]
MRKFKIITRSMSIGLILISLWFISQTPTKIVTHFNGLGTADGRGSRWWLLLMPVIVVVLVEISIGTSRRQRRSNGMGTVNLLTPFESKGIGGIFVIVIITVGIMLQQIGWVH